MHIYKFDVECVADPYAIFRKVLQVILTYIMLNRTLHYNMLCSNAVLIMLGCHINGRGRYYVLYSCHFIIC